MMDTRLTEDNEPQVHLPQIPNAEELIARLKPIRQQLKGKPSYRDEERQQLTQIASELVALASKAKSQDMRFLGFMIELAAIEALDGLADIDTK